jgi:hypothetical protein
MGNVLLGFGRGSKTTHHRVTKFYTEPKTWMESLEQHIIQFRIINKMKLFQNLKTQIITSCA